MNDPSVDIKIAVKNAAMSMPNILLPLSMSLGAAVIFMLCSFAFYWPSPEIAFRTDDSPVAWLSSAQLWAMAILLLRLWQEKALPRLMCIWLCLAMLGMAFDEQFMLHEHWKYHCVEWMAACSYNWMKELPMLLVGLGGGVTGLILHRYFKHKNQRRLLWSAIAVGIFALYLRFMQQPADLLPYKAALLVLAEALFMGLLFSLPHQQKN
ncbi:hypothetical protein [Undibacterium flavidum]|uniref:Uncharacterized protein n=1 Tax=Undibacterium flavidum TaxID=2762297 RepID=A0ABR6YF49_9BURK|nr:hypothetical protein [Undibacterium flavidum]MBC3875185.1 hypothetical protein [Undibacterium flavidum]